ncbi:MAG TPA: hypothetical protein VKV36_01580 [Acidimicrobiales bacterium]|nr:hypothetical protein [Acidimicrobiales bacterium]
MFTKAVAVVAVTGALAILPTGMAGAEPAPGASPTVVHDCTRAAKVLQWLEKAEQRGSTFVTRAQQREEQARAAGHPIVAARIEHRIDRAQRLEGRGSRLIARIQAACPTA